MDAGFLWQFRFSRYDAARIVSIDQGFCLVFRPQEPGGDWGQVALEKSSASIRQRWHFFAWWELSRGPGIASNAVDGVRRDVAKFEKRSALKGLARLDAELAAIGRGRKTSER